MKIFRLHLFLVGSPGLEDIHADITTTIALLLFLGRFCFSSTLRGMSRVVLLLTFNRAVCSLLATRTALQCGSVLGLLCTAVAACIFGLLFASLSETRAETRMLRGVGLLAGPRTV